MYPVQFAQLELKSQGRLLKRPKSFEIIGQREKDVAPSLSHLHTRQRYGGEAKQMWPVKLSAFGQLIALYERESMRLKRFGPHGECSPSRIEDGGQRHRELPTEISQR